MTARGVSTWLRLAAFAIFVILGPLVGAALLVAADAAPMILDPRGAPPRMLGLTATLGLILGAGPALVTGLVAFVMTGLRTPRSTYVLSCGAAGFVLTAIAPLMTKIGASGALAFGLGGGLVAVILALITVLWAVPASRVE